MLLSLLAVNAHADDTGTLSGTVFDQTGEPVAAATVKISGERLPLGRTVESAPSGAFLFEYLVPGEYVIVADKGGLSSARRTAIVAISKDTQVDLVIGLTIQDE